MKYYDEKLVEIYLKYYKEDYIHLFIGEISECFFGKETVVDFFTKSFDEKYCARDRIEKSITITKINILNCDINKNDIITIDKNNVYDNSHSIEKKLEYKKVIHDDIYKRFSGYIEDNEVNALVGKIVGNTDFDKVIFEYAKNNVYENIYKEYEHEIYTRMTIDEIYNLFKDVVSLEDVKDTMDYHINERKYHYETDTYVAMFRQGYKLSYIEILYKILSKDNIDHDDYDSIYNIMLQTSSFSKCNIDKILMKDVPYICDLIGCEDYEVLKLIKEE